MAYRRINDKIWNDAKFRSLSKDAKLLFFFLQTHPSMTPVGALRANSPGLAAELRWDINDYQPAFGQLTQSGIVRVDEDAGLIFLPNFLHDNPPQSPNVVISWGDIPDSLPECPLKVEILAFVVNFLGGYSDSFRKALSESFPAAPALPPGSRAFPKDGDGHPCESVGGRVVSIGTGGPELKDVVLSIGESNHITIAQSLISAWEREFPGIDVSAELRNVKEFLVNASSGPKTERGLLSMIVKRLVKASKSKRGSAAVKQRPLLPPAIVSNNKSGGKKRGRGGVSLPNGVWPEEGRMAATG